MRAAAAKALGLIGDERAAPALEKTLQTPSFEGSFAEMALYRIGKKLWDDGSNAASVAVLCKALKGSDHAQATELLGEIRNLLKLENLCAKHSRQICRRDLAHLSSKNDQGIGGTCRNFP